jgi:hypothetical protein
MNAVPGCRVTSVTLHSTCSFQCSINCVGFTRALTHQTTLCPGKVLHRCRAPVIALTLALS